MIYSHNYVKLLQITIIKDIENEKERCVFLKQYYTVVQYKTSQKS